MALVELPPQTAGPLELHLLPALAEAWPGLGPAKDDDRQQRGDDGDDDGGGSSTLKGPDVRSAERLLVATDGSSVDISVAAANLSRRIGAALEGAPLASAPTAPTPQNRGRVP